MASMPGARHVPAPSSPRSDAASGHDTDTPGSFQRGKRKFAHTTAAQRQTLLEWLELPGNFDLLTKPVSARVSEWGTTAASSTSPPPKRVKKTDGYRAMAQYMNREAGTDWSEKTARSRFESFMAAYRKAKRHSPVDQLPRVFQRVDALFGPDDRDREARFRSESLGQRSEGSRSPLVFQELATVATTPEMTRTTSLGDQEVTTSPRRGGPVNRALETVIVTSTPTMSGDEAAVSSPLQTLSGEAVTDQALRVESQRLAVKHKELELKQSELRARQEESRQKLRAEVLTRLVEAGKSPAEVREYLAIMEPVEQSLPLRR